MSQNIRLNCFLHYPIFYQKSKNCEQLCLLSLNWRPLILSDNLWLKPVSMTNKQEAQWGHVEEVQGLPCSPHRWSLHSESQKICLHRFYREWFQSELQREKQQTSEETKTHSEGLQIWKLNLWKIKKVIKKIKRSALPTINDKYNELTKQKKAENFKILEPYWKRQQK